MEQKKKQTNNKKQWPTSTSIKNGAKPKLLSGVEFYIDFSSEHEWMFPPALTSPHFPCYRELSSSALLPPPSNLPLDTLSALFLQICRTTTKPWFYSIYECGNIRTNGTQNTRGKLGENRRNLELRTKRLCTVRASTIKPTSRIANYFFSINSSIPPSPRARGSAFPIANA